MRFPSFSMAILATSWPTCHLVYCKGDTGLGGLEKLNDDSWRKSTVVDQWEHGKAVKKRCDLPKTGCPDFLKLRFDHTSWPPNSKGIEETDQPALEAFLLTVPDVLTKKTDSSIVKGLDFDSDFLHGPFRSFKNGSSLVPLLLPSFFSGKYQSFQIIKTIKKSTLANKSIGLKQEAITAELCIHQQS